MSETVDALLRDMLDWLARDARPYDQVMDAWRTSCPRLPVWEDANDRGFVEHARLNGCAPGVLTQRSNRFWMGQPRLLYANLAQMESAG